MIQDPFFIPTSDAVSGPRISLSKRISAIELVRKEDGRAKLGLLSQLGPGTIVEQCGEGFNERTVKVRTNGQVYFVFRQDWEAQAPKVLVAFRN